MVELTADRLVLVDDGTAKDYAGSMEDYIDFVLGRNQPKKDGAAKQGKTGGKQSNKARAEARAIKAELANAEKSIAKLQAQCTEIDQAMYEPANSVAHLAQKSMSELLAQRAQVTSALEEAEAAWLELSERLESDG